MNGNSDLQKRQAVALIYDKKKGTPIVVAKGGGRFADRIMEEAEAHDVPIYEDSMLVESLTKLDLGDVIPPELFEVISKIYIYINRVDRIIESNKTVSKQR